MTAPATAGRVLCRSADLAEGQARGFALHDGGETKVIALRRGGRVLGWLDLCPHYAGGTPMAWRRDAYLNADGSRLVCFSHNALFDPETGECTDGPCLGKRLRRIPLVEEAGAVRLARRYAQGPRR